MSLLTLDNLTLHQILDLLPTPSLSQLLQTCTSLYYTTSNYVHHCVLASNRDVQLEKFYLRNSELLLPRERSFCGVNWSGLEYTLKHYAALNCIPDSDYIVRHSLTKCECFGWYGDEKYAVPDVDDELDREVVALKEIAFLTFSKLFHAVPRGQYRVMLHFYISQEVKWGNVGQPAVISISKVKGEVKESVVTHMLENTLWRSIVEGLEHPMIRRRCEDWYFLSFPLSLDEECNLMFSWDDRLNYWYKSGMKYDYVEIRSC